MFVYALFSSLSLVSAATVFPTLNVRALDTASNSSSTTPMSRYSNNTATASADATAAAAATSFSSISENSTYSSKAFADATAASAAWNSTTAAASNSSDQYTTITTSDCSDGVCSTVVSTALRTTMVVTMTDGDSLLTTWVPISTITPSSSTPNTIGAAIPVTTTDANGVSTTSTSLASFITDASAAAAAANAGLKSTLVTVVDCEDGTCTTSTSAVYYSTTQLTETDPDDEETVYIPFPSSSASPVSVSVTRAADVTQMSTTWTTFTSCEDSYCVTGLSASAEAVSTYKTLVPTNTVISAHGAYVVSNDVASTLNASTYSTTAVVGNINYGNGSLSDFYSTYLTTQAQNVTYVPTLSTVTPSYSNHTAAVASVATSPAISFASKSTVSSIIVQSSTSSDTSSSSAFDIANGVSQLSLPKQGVALLGATLFSIYILL